MISNPKKVCIVGYGSIGKRHHQILQDILDPESEFTICDLNFGANVDEVCHKTFDIVLVCTDTITHVDIALKFKKVNNILFIEKPISFSYEDAVRLEGHPARDKIHVGCNIRFTPFYEKIKAVSKEVRTGSVVSMSHLPAWRPGTDHLKSYSANVSLGGGVLLDFIHEPDYVASIFGLPKSSMISSRKVFDNLTVDSPDTCAIIWEYENKTMVFNLCYGAKEYVRSFTYVTDDGKRETIEIDLAEFRTGYRPQWEHILEQGPVNGYNECIGLLKILELQ